jgi:hypothetical protein
MALGFGKLKCSARVGNSKDQWTDSAFHDLYTPRQLKLIEDDPIDRNSLD